MPAFDDDFAAADALFAEAFGGEVTYVCGKSEIVVIAEAVINDYEIDDGAGVLTIVHSTDFVIATALLVVDGNTFAPQLGQRIKKTINGTVEVFQVMPIADRPAAEHNDASGTAWLIHTKHIGSE